MSLYLPLNLKSMGVMNFTPNSFSDGGELSTVNLLEERLESFGPVDILDIGAESTAPMNASITPEEEWKRLSPYLSWLLALNLPLSIDTYHPETIFKFCDKWIEYAKKSPLIWNDVSGKIDDSVRDFLNRSDNFHYVFCHNLAPTRALSGSHMSYLSHAEGDDFLQELSGYFKKFHHPRLIIDPCLGFSKTYEQNWYVLEHFEKLQQLVPAQRWLVGFSRKSFLRKKYGIEKVTPATRDQLDDFHRLELARLKKNWQGEIWIRTHRPSLLK